MAFRFALDFLMERLSRILRFPVLGLYRTGNAALAGTLTVKDDRDGQSYRIQISRNSIQAADVQQIGQSGGLRVYDPGLRNTIVKESQISHIDGEHGTLSYRGYSIEFLFQNHDWEEASFLLIWNKLPTETQKRRFRSDLNAALGVPQAVAAAIAQLPRSAPTYSIVLTALGAFNAVEPDYIPAYTGRSSMYRDDMNLTDEAIVRSIACMGSCVALAYCHRHGQSLSSADPKLSFVANILKMMNFADVKGHECSDKTVRLLEKAWLLYCDHEMSNSTAAFLHVSSTLTDTISACSAFIVSGYGPLHGGAIHLALQAFQRLKTPEDAANMIADVKAKKYRLFGYGHRVYKTTDPRLKHIRGILDELNEPAEQTSPWLEAALLVDRMASEDEYFVKRRLHANADFFGGLAFTAMGFEADVTTFLFAIARMPGITAHWRESMDQPICLWRPQLAMQEP